MFIEKNYLSGDYIILNIKGQRLSEALYIINSKGIAYHQLRKKLYIINAKHCISSSRQKYTPEGVMRYKGGVAALDNMHADA